MLPDLYRRCELMLLNPRGPDVGRVRGGLPAGISLNVAAMTIRTEMMAVLASWAGLVVEERPVRQPPERDIRALAGFLGKHLAWLARHSAARDAAAEIAGLVTAASDMLSTDTEVRVELGPCARAGCGDVVSVVVGGGGEEALKTIKCDRGHVWPPQQWLMLKDKIERARRGQKLAGGERAERRA